MSSGGVAENAPPPSIAALLGNSPGEIFEKAFYYLKPQWKEDTMFVINDDGTIYLTRGDFATFEITAKKAEDENYIFKVGDIVRFTVTEKKQCNSIVLTKDINVTEEGKKVVMILDQTDTKLGEIIHKPKDYWYEVVLNPDTVPQTIVGYDSNGPKILRLFPEGDDSV